MLQEKIRQLIDSWQALYVVLALSLIPFLHWFSLLFMTLICLRQHWQKGLVFLLAVAAGSAFSAVYFMSGGATSALMAAAIPLFLGVLANVLRETGSWQRVFQALSLAGVLTIVILYRSYPELMQEWSLLFTAYLKDIAVEQPKIVEGMGAATWQKTTEILAQFAPGFRVLGVLSFSAITLMVARSFQSSLYYPGGFRREFHAWRQGRSFGITVLFAIGIAFYIQNTMWLSILAVLLLPLFCSGVSCLQALTVRWKYQFIALLLFYVCMLMVLPQLMGVVILLGWLDCFFDFRKRTKNEVHL